MTVLITGSCGFIGTNLAERLYNEGFSLISLDLISPPNLYYKAHYNWDQIDDIRYDNLDCIVHLAGIAHDTKKKTDIDKYFQINYGLTKKLIDKLNTKETSIRAPRFIFISSIKACADSCNEIINEDSTCSPQSPYGQSKLLAEKYVKKYANSYILRLAMVHGPGSKGNLYSLFQYAKSGLPWPLGKINNKRSILGIENLCYILSRTIRGELPQGLYCISDDEVLSTNEIITILWHALGKTPRILNFNPRIIKLLCIAGDFLGLPINTGNLSKLSEDFIVSNEKIKKSLSIKRMPQTSKDGLYNAFYSHRYSDTK